MSEPNKAAAAILAVMQTVTKAHKSGENKHQHYKFVEHATLVPEIRNALIAEGCIMVPVAGEHTLTPKADGKGWHGTVSHRFNIIHCESGDTIQVGPVAGEGFDSGDKTIPKANTNAHKYAILLTFMLPSDDDPEGDERTDSHAGRQPSPQRENPTTAAESAPSDVLDQQVPWGKHAGQTWRWVCDNESDYITGYILPKAERVDKPTKDALAAYIEGISISDAVPSAGTPLPPEIADANMKMLASYWKMACDESGLTMPKETKHDAFLEWATLQCGRELGAVTDLTEAEVASMKKALAADLVPAVEWLKEWLPF